MTLTINPLSLSSTPHSYSCFSFLVIQNLIKTNYLFACSSIQTVLSGDKADSQRQQLQSLFKSALSLRDLAVSSLFSQYYFYLKQTATQAEYSCIKSICCILQWHFISLSQLNVPYLLDCKGEINKSLISLPSLYSPSLFLTYTVQTHTHIHTCLSQIHPHLSSHGTFFGKLFTFYSMLNMRLNGCS